MLRIFFSVLTLVASAVTFTIETTELWKYIPMGCLIVITLILWISEYSESRASKRKITASEIKDSQKNESLADFGILEIRPKTSDSPNSGPASPNGGINKAVEQPKPVQLSILTETYPVEADPLRTSFKTHDPLDKKTLPPILRGILKALDAHAVGIIRAVSDDDEYKVIGTVGHDWLRLRGETFKLKHNLLQDSETTAIYLVGENELQSNHLNYSRTPGMITGFGVTLIGKTGNLLVVDSVSEGGITHPRAFELLEIFGQTFALLLYKEDPDRPRLEIVSDEMIQARAKKQELAFALIAPQRAEELTQTYGDFLEEIEKPLSDCLNRASSESRVIKFGELLYGVFTDGDKEPLERWHQSIQEEITTQGGLLTGGVFIGVAVMNTDHQTPDDLRNDAKRALVEAYNGPVDTVIV